MRASRRTPDYTGAKIGHLTVLRKEGLLWVCQCDCGILANRTTGSLNKLVAANGRARCWKCPVFTGEGRVTHGQSNKRPYIIWGSMVKRCTNPKTAQWKDYGGRGIALDPRWLSFSPFWGDMGATYSDDLSLDRVDVNGNYNKANCAWVPLSHQWRNRRDTVRVQTPDGEMCLSDIAAKVNIPPPTLYTRYHKGYRGDKLVAPRDLRLYRETNRTETITHWPEPWK